MSVTYLSHVSLKDVLKTASCGKSSSPPIPIPYQPSHQQQRAPGPSDPRKPQRPSRSLEAGSQKLLGTGSQKKPFLGSSLAAPFNFPQPQSLSQPQSFSQPQSLSHGHSFSQPQSHGSSQCSPPFAALPGPEEGPQYFFPEPCGPSPVSCSPCLASTSLSPLHCEPALFRRPSCSEARGRLGLPPSPFEPLTYPHPALRVSPVMAQQEDEQEDDEERDLDEPPEALDDDLPFAWAPEPSHANNMPATTLIGKPVIKNDSLVALRASMAARESGPQSGSAILHTLKTKLAEFKQMKVTRFADHDNVDHS